MIAVAAEDLDRVGGDPHRGVAGDQFTDRRPPAGVAVAGVDRGAGRVQERPGGLGRGVHVGQHRLDHLELADRLAELDPLAWRSAAATSSAPWAIPTAWAAIPGRRALERPHREGEALALGADPVRRRDADAVEQELRRRRAADPHLVLDPADREARASASRRRSRTGSGGACRPGR